MEQTTNYVPKPDNTERNRKFFASSAVLSVENVVNSLGMIRMLLNGKLTNKALTHGLKRRYIRCLLKVRQFQKWMNIVVVDAINNRDICEFTEPPTLVELKGSFKKSTIDNLITRPLSLAINDIMYISCPLANHLTKFMKKMGLKFSYGYKRDYVKYDTIPAVCDVLGATLMDEKRKKIVKTIQRGFNLIDNRSLQQDVAACSLMMIANELKKYDKPSLETNSVLPGDGLGVYACTVNTYVFLMIQYLRQFKHTRDIEQRDELIQFLEASIDASFACLL